MTFFLFVLENCNHVFVTQKRPSKSFKGGMECINNECLWGSGKQTASKNHAYQYFTKTMSSDSKNIIEISRFDFYQNINNVTLDLYAKKPLPDSVKSLQNPLEQDLVTYDAETQTIHLKFDISDNTIDYSLKLAHPVDKIIELNIGFKKFEVTLSKKDQTLNWKTVEFKEGGNGSNAHLFNTDSKIDSTTNVLKQPYTSKTDWANFKVDDTPEIKEEVAHEGEDENAFFQKIFANSTEEQQKAMIKSMQESSGTVLSTDWDKVKDGKVEPNLPDGAESINL